MRRPESRPGLYRDTETRKLGGVCSGLAKWSGTPSVLWRLGFAVAFLGWGTGLVLYALLWFLMDDPPKPKQPALGPGDMSPEDREIFDAVRDDMKSLDLRNG
jgi:phage shock protein PspC (stress-responsive transcriptional regulator)